MDLVQTFMSQQRLSVHTEMSIWEAWLRRRRVEPKAVFDALQSNSLIIDGAPVNFGDVKSHFRRYFELIIWTLMLAERSFTGEDPKPESWKASSRPWWLLKGFVQPVLLDYWLGRFIDPKTDKPFSQTPSLKRPDGKRDIDRSVTTLGEYMNAIYMAFQKNRVSLLTSGKLIPKAALLKLPHE